MIKKLGKIFFNGFVTLLPIIITIWILYSIFNFLDGIVGGFLKDFTGVDIKGAGILSVIVLSFIVGILTNLFLGKKLVHFTEVTLYRLPIVNTIYSSVKKMNEILFMQRKTKIKRRVCAVEYPRKGIYSLGFATGEGVKGVGNKKTKYVNVFIPNTPAPATGFTIIVPKKEINFLNISVEDALKIIVSGGTLS